jgi:hypothetical protein
MRVLAAFASLLLCACATWTSETRTEETVYQTLHAVDGLETLHIADEPTRFHEVNPLLSEHPTPNRVATYFVGGAVVHVGITAFLVHENAPVWLLRTWEGLGIGLEAGLLGYNAHDGITPTLSFKVQR